MVTVGTIVFLVFYIAILLVQVASTITVYVARDSKTTIMSEADKKAIDTATMLSWGSLIVAMLMLAGFKIFGASLSKVREIMTKNVSTPN
jgi:hypothetical protein